MKQRRELHELMSRRNNRPFWYHAESRCIFDSRSGAKQGEAISLGVDHPYWKQWRVKSVFNIVEARNLWVQFNPKHRDKIIKVPGVEYHENNSAQKTDVWGPGIFNINHTHFINHPTKIIMMAEGLRLFTDQEVTRKGDNDLYLNGKKIAGNSTYVYAGTTLYCESGFFNAHVEPEWADLLPEKFRQPMTGVLNEDPDFDIIGYFTWLYDNVRNYR